MKQGVKIIKYQGGKRNQMIYFPFTSSRILRLKRKNMFSGEESLPQHNGLRFTFRTPMEEYMTLKDLIGSA